MQLFHRTTRRIDLTTEGEAYLLSCKRVLEELNQTESFLTTGHQRPVGRLRVDLPTTFGRRHIMPTLLKLGLRYEELSLSVTLRDRAVDMVGEGIDLAIRIGGLENYPDLIARQLGEQRLFICASPDYLQRRGTPLTRDDLSEHDCLTGWHRGSRPVWLLKNDDGESEPYDVRSHHELTDGDALLCACMAGCGLAQLPGWLAEEALTAGTLVSVVPDLTGSVMPIHVVWQKTWHFQPKVRVAVDELISFAQMHPEIFKAA